MAGAKSRKIEKGVAKTELLKRHGNSREPQYAKFENSNDDYVQQSRNVKPDMDDLLLANIWFTDVAMPHAPLCR